MSIKQYCSVNLLWYTLCHVWHKSFDSIGKENYDSRISSKRVIFIFSDLSEATIWTCSPWDCQIELFINKLKLIANFGPPSKPREYSNEFYIASHCKIELFFSEIVIFSYSFLIQKLHRRTLDKAIIKLIIIQEG